MKTLAKPVNKDIFKSGDLVRVIGNVHDPGLPKSRTGIIIEMLPNPRKNISDCANILFHNQEILKFHVCHLRKIALT